MAKLIKKHSLIITLIILNLAFAVLFGGDFGDSYDEAARYEAGLEGLSSLSNLEASQHIGDKGKIYFITAKLGGDLIQQIQPAYSNIQAWHHIHFLFFLFAVVGVYSIGLEYLSPIQSFATAALFNTQPLLFGHAFINPKDIPFLALFTLTIAAGLEIPGKFTSDRKSREDPLDLNVLGELFQSEWKNASHVQRILSLIALVPVGMVVILKVLEGPAQQYIQRFINNLNGNWLETLLSAAAQNILGGNLAGGITLQNVQTAYPYLLFLTVSLGGLLMLIALAAFFTRTTKYALGITSWKSYWIDLKQSAKNPWVFLGGFILGYSISNRSLGLAAGLYILLLMWTKIRAKFLPTAVLYVSTALLTLYLTWPALWANPVLGLLKSVLSVSSFSWGGKTLFWGTGFSPQNLPPLYFPTLLAIQFTIPVLILTLIGLAVSIIKWKEFQLDPILFLIIALWFGLPFASIVLLKPAIYDNFRHFLFITPPIFLVAGLGLRYLFTLFSSQAFKTVLILLILLPGILGIINLHPYQYIYYNELVGGAGGAFRDFETDYWYTSYVECIEYLNEIAPQNATILVYGPTQIVESYARKDFRILTYRKDNQAAQFAAADYFILTTRGNKDLELALEAQEIYSVSRTGAKLSVIRRLSPE